VVNQLPAIRHQQDLHDGSSQTDFTAPFQVVGASSLSEELLFITMRRPAASAARDGSEQMASEVEDGADGERYESAYVVRDTKWGAIHHGPSRLQASGAVRRSVVFPSVDMRRGSDSSAVSVGVSFASPEMSVVTLDLTPVTAAACIGRGAALEYLPGALRETIEAQPNFAIKAITSALSRSDGKIAALARTADGDETKEERKRQKICDCIVGLVSGGQFASSCLSPLVHIVTQNGLHSAAERLVATQNLSDDDVVRLAVWHGDLTAGFLKTHFVGQATSRPQMVCALREHLPLEVFLQWVTQIDRWLLIHTDATAGPIEDAPPLSQVLELANVLFEAKATDIALSGDSVVEEALRVTTQRVDACLQLTQMAELVKGCTEAILEARPSQWRPRGLEPAVVVEKRVPL